MTGENGNGELVIFQYDETGKIYRVKVVATSSIRKPCLGNKVFQESCQILLKKGQVLPWR